MAEMIASNTESVLVPLTLGRLFHRAIQTRRKVVNWFQARAADKEEGGNGRHQDFITVFEDAVQLLRPFISTGPQATRIGVELDASETLVVENRFANLSLKDVAELAEDEAVDELQLPVVTPVVLKRDDADLEEELDFAVGLLFEELHSLRNVACAQWERYKLKDTDLIVAAITADTAIKLAQKVEAEFELLVSRPKQFPVSTYPVWKLLDPIAKPSEAQPEDLNAQTVSSFWPTYLGLKCYLDRMMQWDPTKNLPAIVPQNFGDNPPHALTLRAIEYAQVIRISMFGN
jgi:hypothetical protein